MVAMPRALNALIVDDDVGVRHSVGEVLAKAGCRSVTAGSEVEAVQKVRVHRVDFSILDVHVRADDGLRILTSLREVIRNLPVIFMSGAFTPEIVTRARDLGAHQCLEKPLDLRVLLAAVENLIKLEDL